MSDQGLIVVMDGEDEQFIVDNYERLTAQQLADELGVTRRVITYKLEMFTKSGRIARTKRPRRSPRRLKETLNEETDSKEASGKEAFCPESSSGSSYSTSIGHLSTNLQSHDELIPSELDGLSGNNISDEGEADEGVIENSSGGDLRDDDNLL
jgi:hypothetical protein